MPATTEEEQQPAGSAGDKAAPSEYEAAVNQETDEGLSVPSTLPAPAPADVESAAPAMAAIQKALARDDSLDDMPPVTYEI